MRHQLDDAGRIKLLRATTEMMSQYGRSTIQCGEHAVAVETPGKYDSMLWYAIDELDAFTAELREFEPSEPGELERFGPLNSLVYNRSSTGAGCRVCGNSENRHKDFIRLDRHLSSMPWIHLDCVPEFCETVERVWEHAPELLIERV